jgi:hypothetical protein
VVLSPFWDGSRGAATWGSGATGVSGAVSAADSLVGSNPNDLVGGNFTGPVHNVLALSNGNYVVLSPAWDGFRGAATWGSGTSGVSGTVSAANSLVGSNPNDMVGGTGMGPLRNVVALSNGNYVLATPSWDGNRGAATWGSGTSGVSGPVSAANSLVGSSPNDRVGANGVTGLSNGNYVVISPNWNGYRGAATWASGTSGLTLDGDNTITPQNSLVGLAANSGFGGVVDDPVNQSFLAPFSTDGGGRVVIGLVDPNQFSYDRAQGQTVTLTPAFLSATLNAGTAVVLQASNDITVNSPILVSAGGAGGALTLQAGRSILINANIRTDGGDLALIANDPLANGVVDAQRDPGPAVVTMAPGTELATGAGALTVELRDGAGKSNADSGAVTLQAVTAGSLSVTNDGPSPGSDVILGPVTTAGAQSYSAPNGTTTVTGDLTTADSPVTFNQSVVLVPGLTLSVGAGTVTFGGTVAPAPGALTVAGGLALAGSATFCASLGGAGPDGYPQVLAGGPLSLGGSTLKLVLNFTPDVGDAFTLLSLAGSDPLPDTFAGLDEGAVFCVGGLDFQITYQGGPNGNSVVVTRVG